ncbi:hypothetical protein A2X44_03675 [candidate division CPR3 bacterium GWF2_35_18]|uniref:PT repeat-containing protein n=1 Tax=candidate division CPR3 bacterium GW2011_GWF2_35_18 TaxID=1618350 RepID=A0A0G0BJN2_UNCC3|nr:MAG: hypothetical protein UR67_C0004G0025 [candidate division CPR3 bacterium GW2011_GWF2_35_18]KKP87069.1 MAG: hypothetical protein UR87_C0005G0008 [candidate division CPR3 bacterium GW2011_GWE2_35_7]OGB63112.1 MAG: hypothetical protein A2X44_03675 [candidate division CPR3 bacterium GWF2_35_18]OGB64074.1 MAG: hypothetical protein A2250_04715 [candidate division CPR3 bacterium RIFOXYA2_FULL_35_13]OGB80612.1 MAG: hypothetical protein A2011_03445 [candidate division CPR3 bacterium GWE2_35_7]
MPQKNKKGDLKAEKTSEIKKEVIDTESISPELNKDLSTSKKTGEEKIIKLDVEGKEIKEETGISDTRKKPSKIVTWFRSLNKTQKIIYSVLLVVLLGIFIFGSIFLFKALGLGKWENDNPVVNQSEATKSATDKNESKDHESPLTGTLITKTKYDEIVERRPMGVIIENHVDARPQSGLNDADLVWEALAEGGISRFEAIYLENAPDKVGPVRSLRKYFLDFIAELRDGLVMHIGYADTDNPDTDALGYIYNYNIKSLGLFVPNNFWRVSTKVAPHNAYASVKDLWQKAEDKGWTGIVDLTRWQFKEDSEQATLGEIDEISFNWQTWGVTDYSVKWTFDAEQNLYFREQNTVKHTDAETGDQISAKNIILQLNPASFTVDTDSKSRLIYDLIGEGDAYIFRDGEVIKVKWKKSERVSRTIYYDESGTEIEFNRGRTWISVLPIGSEIVY